MNIVRRILIVIGILAAITYALHHNHTDLRFLLDFANRKPMETDGAYLITREDFKFLCEKQSRGFKNPIKVPSGVIIRYEEAKTPSAFKNQDGSPAEDYTFTPVKKIKVINP